jgi:hypothetical protein
MDGRMHGRVDGWIDGWKVNRWIFTPLQDVLYRGGGDWGRLGFGLLSPRLVQGIDSTYSVSSSLPSKSPTHASLLTTCLRASLLPYTFILQSDSLS